MIKFEAQKISIKADWVEKLKLKELALQECLNTRTRLVQQTQSGHGADGQALKEYSKAYKERKIASGRTGATDLTVTQGLLRSMIPSATPYGAQISFQGAHNQSENRLKKREAKLQKQLQEGRAVKARGARKAKDGATKSKGFGVKKIPKAPKVGRSIQNSTLAQALYDKGFVGWFYFGQPDKDRITKAVNERISQTLKNLVDIK